MTGGGGDEREFHVHRERLFLNIYGSRWHQWPSTGSSTHADGYDRTTCTVELQGSSPPIVAFVRPSPYTKQEFSAWRVVGCDEQMLKPAPFTREMFWGETMMWSVQLSQCHPVPPHVRA
ncbi:hypothetical protein CIHG_07927 [Coccidioides immitis H538.4]|uniref:Uncharacterized protein n=2 Tax=Coccidioides immitis TaxID=5501 RepID=A0A0J8RZB2_COCIT|nr:hypothetical protein CIRG_10137 [Coccidioides immitis RMSCC 2394]KMU90117.1 hypothetical protein CIHG_07927 [Coccidioides immitis H538.4]